MSGLLAVHTFLKLQHLLVIWVQGEGGSTITESAWYIPDVLMESRPEMQQVQVGFEGYRTAELRYCIVLLVAIHQHCENQNQNNVLTTYGEQYMKNMNKMYHCLMLFILAFSQRHDMNKECFHRYKSYHKDEVMSVHIFILA